MAQRRAGREPADRQARQGAGRQPALRAVGVGPALAWQGSNRSPTMKKCLSVVLILVAAALAPANAQEKTLRIAMTASDIPTPTGMPNNGFEGMRFLGFPVF